MSREIASRSKQERASIQSFSGCPHSVKAVVKQEVTQQADGGRLGHVTSVTPY